MTTPENPPKLWAFAKIYGGEDYVGIFAETEECAAEGERASHEDDERCAPVVAYVPEAEATRLRAALQSIAALQTEEPAP